MRQPITAPPRGSTSPCGRLFVVGGSGTGKTPLARNVAAAYGVPHISASDWVRRLFPSEPGQDRQAHIEAMTRFSLEALAANPLACLEDLGRHHALSLPCVIEGMRNPSDLVRTFDPRADRCLSLRLEGNPLQPTTFESGLEVIDSYLRWLIAAGLMPADRYRSITCGAIADLDPAIGETVAWVSDLFPTAGLPAGRRALVHADVPQIRTAVREEILYNNDPARVGGRVPCRIFSLSSYPGSSPTFQILLEDGAVFSYVPPSALLPLQGDLDPELSLSELVYHNCPDGDITICEHAALKGHAWCFFRDRQLWLRGSYRFTVDWYQGNTLAHCVSLDNGQIALLPSHKISFGGEKPEKLASYEKMRSEWSV